MDVFRVGRTCGKTPWQALRERSGTEVEQKWNGSGTEVERKCLAFLPGVFGGRFAEHFAGGVAQYFAGGIWRLMGTNPAPLDHIVLWFQRFQPLQLVQRENGPIQLMKGASLSRRHNYHFRLNNDFWRKCKYGLCPSTFNIFQHQQYCWLNFRAMMSKETSADSYDLHISPFTFRKWQPNCMATYLDLLKPLVAFLFSHGFPDCSPWQPGIHSTNTTVTAIQWAGTAVHVKALEISSLQGIGN